MMYSVFPNSTLILLFNPSINYLQENPQGRLNEISLVELIEDFFLNSEDQIQSLN